MLRFDFNFTYSKRCNFLTLTSRYGKFIQENLYQTLSESASFRKRYDKNILMCFFRFTVLTAVHLQNANAKFHKVGYRDTIRARQKTFIFLYDKFIQDNMYQILSQSVRFCRLYMKNIFVCFFSVYSVFEFV